MSSPNGPGGAYRSAQHDGTPVNAALPAQPFFATPQQRLALARQRYFDEGQRPSGLVSEGVIQSWSRCMQARREPVERIAFDPITPSGVHSALARSRLLLEAATGDLRQLEHTLAGTATTVFLTDASGVVVHATRSNGHAGEVLLPLVRRVGVSLDEFHIGTGAPGLTLRTGQSCTVLGAEHFFGQLQSVYCAAAPIRDIQGRIAGVLDVTREQHDFGFDAAAVVGQYATAIENELLRAQSTDHVVVALQTSAALLRTPLVGLAGIDSHGRIAWVNGVAARLLGVQPGDTGLSAVDFLGLDAAQAARLTRASGPLAQRLPNGLAVWMTASMQARDGAARPHATHRAFTAPPAPGLLAAAAQPGGAGTLRDVDQLLVARTVEACGGNVSQAARRLGVSRGLVYRHLRAAAHAAPEPGAVAGSGGALPLRADD